MFNTLPLSITSSSSSSETPPSPSRTNLVKQDCLKIKIDLFANIFNVLKERPLLCDRQCLQAVGFLIEETKNLNDEKDWETSLIDLTEQFKKTILNESEEEATREISWRLDDIVSNIFLATYQKLSNEKQADIEASYKNYFGAHQMGQQFLKSQNEAVPVGGIHQSLIPYWCVETLKALSFEEI